MKTGKEKRLKIQPKLLDEITAYVDGMTADAFLFQSQKGENAAISRVQFYRILSEAAKDVGIPGNIGTHSMRKTMGYHLYQQTKDVALVQNLLNHSAPSITMRYIGINDDLMDRAMDEFDYQ
jgi:integrase